jgi:hypothetical protein
MLRFVGNGLIESDFVRADAWIQKLEQLKAAGLNHAYLFIHEPDDAYAPEMAIYFIEKLNATLKTSLHKPALGEYPGAQMSLF